MTQNQAQTIEQALARAIREGIRIVAKLGTPESPIFYTTSSAGGETNLYRVTCTGQQLTCSCPATGICKHRAICHAELKAERTEAPAPAVKPTKANALPYDHAGEGFSIFKPERPEHRYQTLEDEYAARDGYASSDYYQAAYR